MGACQIFGQNTVNKVESSLNGEAFQDPSIFIRGHITAINLPVTVTQYQSRFRIIFLVGFIRCLVAGLLAITLYSLYKWPFYTNVSLQYSLCQPRINTLLVE